MINTSLQIEHIPKHEKWNIYLLERWQSTLLVAAIGSEPLAQAESMERIRCTDSL